MTNYLDEIKNALIEPDVIVPHKFDEIKVNYYLYLKNKRRYILVAVKYLNGEGLVAKAFVTRNIRKR